MNDWKTTVVVVLTIGLGGAVMLSSQGIAPYWAIPVAAAVGIVMAVAAYFDNRANKRSFKEAEQFSAGYAFKNPAEEQKYRRWAEKDHRERPAASMLSDLIARYRSPRIAAYLLGVLGLGLIEIILFKEKAEGKGEPFVIYLVLGGMLLLLYFAVSDIAGIKARRLYGRLEQRPDFMSIERSYNDGIVIGQPRSCINLGSEYITLIIPSAVIPIKRSELVRVCRADVLTAYYTNSIYTGSNDSYFIKFYTGSAEYRVQFKKFLMIYAYDILKAAGLPADDTIDMR